MEGEQKIENSHSDMNDYFSRMNDENWVQKKAQVKGKIVVDGRRETVADFSNGVSRISMSLQPFTESLIGKRPEGLWWGKRALGY